MESKHAELIKMESGLEVTKGETGEALLKGVHLQPEDEWPQV